MKKTGTNLINSRKWKLTFAVLIFIFSLISVSAAISEKELWVASIEKNEESIIFANHSESPTEGGWIFLSGGKEIQLPQPLNFTYNGTDSLERAGTTFKLNPESKSKSKSDQEDITELVFTYPYSTHSFILGNRT